MNEQVFAGYLTGNEPLGIWLGVSLQLLAAGQGPQADWSLAGVVAALAILVTPRLASSPTPGDPASVALFGSAVVVAIGARKLELRRARLDGDALRAESPWDRPDPASAFGRLIRRRMARGLIVGGLQTVLAGGAAVAVTGAAGALGFGSAAQQVAALAVPILGVAVLLGALSSYRHIGLAGAGAAAAMALGVLA